MRSSALFLGFLAVHSIAHGALADDVLSTVLSGTTATNGKTIAAFAYDPIHDRMFVSSYGATPFNAAGAVRRIDNVSGAQVATDLLSEGQVQLYYRNNDTTRSVSTPLQSGFLLNPKAVGSIEAYSQIWVSDAELTRSAGGNTAVDAAATKRVYRYNPYGTPDIYPTNVISTLTTLADLQTAAGATTNTSSNWGRQFAWSTSGQSLYHFDSSTAFGGLWKVNAVTGAANRLVAGDVNTEAAVLDNGNGTERVIGAGSGTNIGGLDYYDVGTGVNDTAVVARGTFLSKADLVDFLDRPATAGAPDVRSMTTDSNGDLYFNDVASTGGGTRTVIRRDAQGRLIKVFSYAERVDTFGTGTSQNSNTLRMQVRGIIHPTAGTIRQLLYVDNANKSVAGANIFAPGDFDRDGFVTAADRSAFLSTLKTRGTAITAGTLSTNGRYDLNGNGNVDWKDVKVLQQFLRFANGDVNLDGNLTLSDLSVLGANYYTVSPSADKTWAQGDIASLEALATTYSATATDANLVNNVDVQTFANAYLTTLGNPFLTLQQVDALGYTGQFRTDVIAALVPEPTSLAVLAAGCGMLLGRRRRTA